MPPRKREVSQYTVFHKLHDESKLETPEGTEYYCFFCRQKLTGETPHKTFSGHVKNEKACDGSRKRKTVKSVNEVKLPEEYIQYMLEYGWLPDEEAEREVEGQEEYEVEEGEDEEHLMGAVGGAHNTTPPEHWAYVGDLLDECETLGTKIEELVEKIESHKKYYKSHKEQIKKHIQDNDEEEIKKHTEEKDIHKEQIMKHQKKLDRYEEKKKKILKELQLYDTEVSDSGISAGTSSPPSNELNFCIAKLVNDSACM